MTRRADVRATYDRIAAHFAATRPEPWPEVVAFLEDRTGGVGLDLGAGNGRHAELLAARTRRAVAADFSRPALDTALARAAERGYDIVPLLADAAALPLATGAVDLAVYVATLHHLPSRGLRLASLDELARVLAPDGAALVGAWSVSHERFDAASAFDTTVDWTLPDGETVPRYYHVYDLDEFSADLDRSDLVAERTFESAGNCYAAVRAGERNAHTGGRGGVG